MHYLLIKHRYHCSKIIKFCDISVFAHRVSSPNKALSENLLKRARKTKKIICQYNRYVEIRNRYLTNTGILCHRLLDRR